MERKNKYIKPLSRIVFLHGSTLMTYGSNTVNALTQGSDITIGDEDEPTTPTTSARGFTWEEE